MQKGQTQVLILAGIVFIALLAGGAYYLGRQTTPKSTPAPVVSYQTPQPTPIPYASREPTSSVASPKPSGVDETANWKTYTGQLYSFKYPLNGKIVASGYYSVDGVFVTNPTITSLNIGPNETDKDGPNFELIISYEDNKNKVSLKDLKDEISPSDKRGTGLDWLGDRIQEMSLDGNPAIKGATAGPVGSYTVITIHNDKIYRFVFLPTINPIGELILSTFKFLK